MVLVTVMNILVAIALPAWSQVMKREREKELIFRGLQYAEAIRVFQATTGRYPVSLRELLEMSRERSASCGPTLFATTASGR